MQPRPISGRGLRPSPVFWLSLLLAAPLLLGRAPARATQQNTQTPTFQSSGQSIWDPTTSSGVNYSADWTKSWSASASPSLSIDGYGGGVTLNTNGQIGLQPSFSVKGGQVDIQYPVQVILTYPDPGTLYPGDPFTISASIQPGTGGSLKTTSAQTSIALDGVLDIHADANWETNLPVVGSSSGSLFDLTIGQSTPYSLLSALSRAENLAIGNYLSSTFYNPDLSTSGGFAGSTLSASTTKPVFSSKLDFTNIALSVTGLPAIERDFSFGPFTASLHIIDGYQTLDLDLSQAFTFQTSPQVKIQLSNGQALTLSDGGSQSLTFPTVSPGAATNNLTFTPTYQLDPTQTTLMNATDLHVDPSWSFTPFHFSFGASLNILGTTHTLGPDTVDPAGTFNIPSADHTVSLYSNTFPLGGFSNIAGTPFTLAGYTYPLPTLTSVTPPAFKPGAATHLSAAGTNFVPPHTNSVTTLPSTTAQWNGANQTTQYQDPMHLTLNLTSAQANTEGIFPVTAVNPAPGGGTSNSENVIIDGTPPVTTPSLSGPQNANNHGWYTNTVTVNLSTNDTLSGVKEVDYQADSNPGQFISTGAPLGPGTFATPSFTVSGEGRHTVSYHGTDNVGNAETPKSTPVNIDGTPPTIAGSRRTPANPYGWNNGPVTVHFDSSDATSGIFSSAPDTMLSGEGSNQSVTGTAVDYAGNSASATVTGINIDLTAPVITYSGNAGTYTPDQTVNITCTSSDPNLKDGTPGSGVLSDTCRPITGDAYSFILGSNTFSASATDKAGNTGTGQTSFTIKVTYDSLCALVERFVTKSGVAHSLCVKLQNAGDAAARGDLTAKSGLLGAFANEVQAQSGKAMTTDQAAILTELAQAL